MRKNHSLYWIIVLIACILVFSAIAFICVDSYTSNFWLGYFITILSWAIFIATLVFMKKDHDRHRNAVFVNTPLVFFAGLHFVFQALSGILTIALSGYNAKLSCSISLALFIVFCVIAAGLAHYRFKTNRNSNTGNLEREFIDCFKFGLKEIELRCIDPAILRLVHEVSETAKYANPNSLQTSKDDEHKLIELLDSLKVAISENNNMLINPICEEMKILLKKRDF